MSVRNVCKTNVVTIDKGSSLKQVSALMSKFHVGSIIVLETIEEKKRPVGIITDRDLALAIHNYSTPENVKVEKVMNPNPITVDCDMGIYDAIKIMRDQGIKRLPVTDYEGSIYGVVSVDDLLSLMGEEIQNLSMIADSEIQHEIKTTPSSLLNDKTQANINYS